MAPRIKVRPNKKGKRWYIDASLPKSVPFIGGSSFKAGSGTMVKRMVQNELKKTQETKINKVSYQSSVLTMNTLYCIAPIQDIAVGTAVNQRVGNQISVKHMRYRVSLNNATLTQVKFRLITVWIPHNTTISSGTFAGAIGTTELFYTTGSDNGIIFSLYNNKLPHTVICDKIITVNADYSGQSKTITKNFDCPINKKITYKPSSTLLTDWNLYTVVIPYSPGATPAVTQIGYINIDSITTFTDD